MASIAYDIRALTRSLDTLDAKGPTSRNLQSAWAMVQACNSMLQDIASGGAGYYTLSEDWAEADRVTYEADIAAAQAGITAAYAALKALVKA